MAALFLVPSGEYVVAPADVAPVVLEALCLEVGRKPRRILAKELSRRAVERILVEPRRGVSFVLRNLVGLCELANAGAYGSVSYEAFNPDGVKTIPLLNRKRRGVK